MTLKLVACLLGSCMCEGVSLRLHISAAEVALLYQEGKMSMDAIASKLGTSKRIIANRLIEAGVPSRGYADRYNAALNASILRYLQNWGNQTPYILGYTMADGSISRPANRTPSVQFACSAADRELLDGIASELSLPFGPREMNKKRQVVLRIHGESIVAAFEKYGILPRKTYLNTPFPEMPPECLPHYLRGVFDGDGCVHYNDDTRVFSVQFLGSKAFIEGLREVLVERVGVRRNSVLKRPGHWCVSWQSASQIKSIYDFLYPEKEDFLFLKRKRHKFQKIILNECHS